MPIPRRGQNIMNGKARRVTTRKSGSTAMGRVMIMCFSVIIRFVSETYADLYTVKPDSGKIARAREVMEYQMSTDKNDYWWWADGLYMVMPVMTKMYKLTGNPLYLEKLHEYWTYANSIMYDSEEGLYYRDGKYIYPKHKSVNGKKDFWARGDGWVLAALAKVLKRPARKQTNTARST